MIKTDKANGTVSEKYISKVMLPDLNIYLKCGYYLTSKIFI